MKVAAVVHAKGNSERVFRKNFRLVNGVPLYLIQAINLNSILDRRDIYIDSDDAEILAVADFNGFSTIKRENQFATNKVGGVQLMEMFLNKVPCDLVVQAFPPAPFLDTKLLQSMLSMLSEGEYKSCMLTNSQSLYKWEDGSPIYDFSENGEIPNSVDLAVTNQELPTLYMVNVESFGQKRSRTPKPCFSFQPDALALIDIDHEQDLELAKTLCLSPSVSRSFNWRSRCRLLAPPILFLDVDGTLTNGFYNSGAENEVFKSFSTLDGTAIKEILKFGVEVCMVTASASDNILDQRASIIGVHLLSNVQDKVLACESFARERNFSLGECAFIGNDVNDILVLESCGLPLCPNDSVSEVRSICKVLNIAGGYGVCRSFMDLLNLERYESRAKI